MGFLNSSNNVKSCREFPKAVTGPFLDHYVLKRGLVSAAGTEAEHSHGQAAFLGFICPDPLNLSPTQTFLGLLGMAETNCWLCDLRGMWHNTPDFCQAPFIFLLSP